MAAETNIPTPTPDDLRDWRERHGLSQPRAAKVARVTTRAWQFWEAGDRVCSPATWELLLIKSGELNVERFNEA